MQEYPWPLNILREFPACQTYARDNLPPDTKLIGESKLDGHRLMVIKDDTGAHGYGRCISSVTKTYMPINIELSYLTRHWPTWSAADGELFVRGQSSAYVATAIAAGENLEWQGFAVPFWAGEDLRKMSYMNNRGFGIRHGIDFVPIQAIFDSPPTRAEIMEITRSRKPPLEGLVLKRPECGYGIGWYKAKEVREVDCVVTGFTEGRGKYFGFIGAIRCSVYDGNRLIEICKAGGMTDEMRVAIDEKNDLGRVVEIKYQQVDVRGRLRHPRFSRWRDDKNARECTMAQLRRP